MELILYFRQRKQEINFSIAHWMSKLKTNSEKIQKTSKFHNGRQPQIFKMDNDLNILSMEGRLENCDDTTLLIFLDDKNW